MKPTKNHKSKANIKQLKHQQTAACSVSFGSKHNRAWHAHTASDKQVVKQELTPRLASSLSCFCFLRLASTAFAMFFCALAYGLRRCITAMFLSGFLFSTLFFISFLSTKKYHSLEIDSHSVYHFMNNINYTLYRVGQKNRTVFRSS